MKLKQKDEITWREWLEESTGAIAITITWLALVGIGFWWMIR